MKKSNVIDLLEIILGIASFVYYFVCVAYEGRGVSILYAWMILGIVLIVKGIIGLAFRTKNNKILRVCILVFDVMFGMFFVCFVTFSAFVVHDMNDKPAEDCDYIIVLGAGLNGDEPSQVLQNRIDAAYNYLIDNEDTMVIGTGGQGEGEYISEGLCIANELISMGISEDRILYENQSTTTVENFRFALEKISDEPESIGVVSSGFHIFRAKLILSDYTDATVYGIPATGQNVMTLHYILRELIVLIVDLLLGNYSII